MNWKAAILLFVVFFAPAITTVAVSLNAPMLSQPGISEGMLLDAGFEPMGDPIVGPDGPH